MDKCKCDLCLWNQGSGGGGSSTLSGLTDVDISNPTDGQTLVYNASAGKWENGAGGGGVIMAQIDGQTGAMNMTWQELHDAMLGGNLVYAVNHYTETGYDAAALFLLYEVVIEEGHYIVSLIDPGESHKEIGEASGGANDYPVFSF